MSNTVTFTISVPADDGFLDRECNNPQCKRFFKVDISMQKEEMYCPYCAHAFSNAELHTPEQLAHIEAEAKEKAREYAYGELDKMFKQLERQFSGSKSVTIKHNPICYQAKSVPYRRSEERTVDTELQCPECSFRFQVNGIFGFCPGCRAENMNIYDTNIAIILREIQKSDSPDRALRHAYNDLVTTYESFCKKNACGIQGDQPSFQELFPAKRFFKEHKSIDIFDGLTEFELLTLRRVFQKRHIYQHDTQGIITEKYVRKVPEDGSLLGTKAALSMNEFNEAASHLRKIIDNMVSGAG